MSIQPSQIQNKKEEEQDKARYKKKEKIHYPMPVTIILLISVVVGAIVGYTIGTEFGGYQASSQVISSAGEALILNATGNYKEASIAWSQGLSLASLDISTSQLLGLIVGGIGGLIIGTEVLKMYGRLLIMTERLSKDLDREEGEE